MDKKKIAEIEKKVDAYIKKGEVKGENGKVTGNPLLLVTPENLTDLFESGTLAGMTREEKMIAKHHYKSKLDYKEYIQSREDNPELRRQDVIKFNKIQENGGL